MLRHTVKQNYDGFQCSHASNEFTRTFTVVVAHFLFIGMTNKSYIVRKSESCKVTHQKNLLERQTLMAWLSFFFLIKFLSDVGVVCVFGLGESPAGTDVLRKCSEVYFCLLFIKKDPH